MKKKEQSQQEFERIERYLTGMMKPEEQAAFENALKTDTSLKQQVEEVSLLIRAVEERSLRNKLDEFHEEITAKGSNVKSIRPWIKYVVAASVVFLIGLGIWLLSGQKNRNEKLFAQYFKPDPGLITPMSTTSNYEFYRGMVDYKQGKYREAIERWNPLLEREPENDTLNFYLGVSFLAKDETGKAIAYLSKTVHYPNSIFISEAWYYLGLAHLKAGNSEEAIRSFKKSDLENSRLILKEIMQTE